ncbi:MAG: hypothetical protein ABW185_18730, partial [Sedimenticola sp.]
MIQHPDLSFQVPKEDKNNEKLLTALNARQNGIIAAHQLGQDKSTILATFDRETLPLSVIPATCINEGKSLTVMVTKQKPVRCTGCQQHGHTAGACPTGIVSCPYCGYNHKYNECPVKKQKYHYQCRNCYDSGYNYRGHGAFDDRCPVFWDYLAFLESEQKRRDALRRKITAQVVSNITTATKHTTITGAAEANKINKINSNPNPQVQVPERHITKPKSSLTDNIYTAQTVKMQPPRAVARKTNITSS